MTLDHLSQAAEAHREALAAQKAMQYASRVRDTAVRAAHDSGYSQAEIARALGVNRQRVHNIIYPPPPKKTTTQGEP